MSDVQEVKSGLILFRRTDVKHRNWYCRIKIPDKDAYKFISLKTDDVAAARDRALEAEADLRFRLKHNIPVFNQLFSQVAADFADLQKQLAEAGQITMRRWRVLDSHIRSQLNRYVGNVQITLIGPDRWTDYPLWRQQNGKGRSGGKVSDGTIRDEMTTFRSVMAFAASKRLIPESQIFKDRLPLAKAAREEFTPEEYRKLHTYARTQWVAKAPSAYNKWHREMAYNFILVMTNTGMRPSEARNLQWADIANRTDKKGRACVLLNVRGKGKSGALVAGTNVGEYLNRIRALSKVTAPNDPVFSTHDGRSSARLYHDLIERLLTASGLLHSASGSRRSTYCFRHTYATFRLSEGVDSLFLAKQMRTSVKMIEDHYGHITPEKNAERILQGLPGWGGCLRRRAGDLCERARCASEAGRRSSLALADEPAN